MKTNAIVRIVLFSIAILILAGILVAGLLYGLYVFHSDSLFSNYESTLPNAYSENSTASAVEAAEIQNLQIEWVAGSIRIARDETASDITVSESYVDNPKYQMICKKSGNTLKIQFCEDSISFPSFGINVNISKDLVITVPSDWICDTLEIDTASARVDIADLTIHEFNFDGASGICNIVNCNVDKIDLDTASGDITFEGTLDVLECEAASANCRIYVTNVPSSIDIDTASGDLELTLPDNCGFTCNLNTMSGSFSSEFATTHQNGHHIYGDGSCAISVDAMSGNVKICKSGDSAPMITEPIAG